MSAKDRKEGVLGLNLAAGTAYLALILRPDELRLDATPRLALASNVDRWSSLGQFGTRLVQEAQANNVVAVAFAEPRKFNAWKYYDAFTRAAIQVAGSLALHKAGISVHQVAQRSAASAIGLALGELDKGLAANINVDAASVSYWRQRVPAIAVALHIARTIWS